MPDIQVTETWEEIPSFSLYQPIEGKAVRITVSDTTPSIDTEGFRLEENAPLYPIIDGATHWHKSEPGKGNTKSHYVGN